MSFFDIGPGLGIFQILFIAVFVIVLGVIVAVAVRGLLTWNKNNRSPRLTVHAVIVAKRTDVSRHSHPVAGDVTGAHGFHSSATTRYYVTFQVDSGDRMELSADGAQYGMLAEGDSGKLTFQGTRYLGFERE